MSDLRFALRQFGRRPVFASAAFVTIAIGIGLTTSVFSLVNALLFRPLPGVRDPGRLVALHTDQGRGLTSSSYMDFADLRDELSAFERLAAFKVREVDVSSPTGTDRLEGQLVTHDYFIALGVRPAAGRFFRPDEDEVPDRDAVAVVSMDYAERTFGSEAAAVGGTLVLNGRSFTVVGVTERGFRGTSLFSAPDVFVPMAMQAHLMPSSGFLLDRRGWGGIYVFGRLAEGVGAETARAELDVMAARLARRYPDTNEGRSFEVIGFREATLPPGMWSTALGFGVMLVALVGLVLLIACVNVANLMLARAVERRREIALRRILGAGGGRVIRQLLTESALLATVGGAAGLLLAVWISGLVDATPLGLRLDYSIDSRVLGFAALATLATGLAFGLAPALRAARSSVVTGLRETPALRLGRKGISANDVLVVVQVALSLAVLAAAGLFGRTLQNLRHLDPGLDPEGVLTARLDPSLQGYEGERIKDFYRAVLDRATGFPGIRGAAISSKLPGPEADNTSISIEGHSLPPGQRLSIQFSFVSADYFETLRIPGRRGRLFDSATAGSPPHLVLNEAAARWLEDVTGRDALAIRVSTEGAEGPFMEVVGVVADVRHGTPRQDPVPHAYVQWEAVPGEAAFSRMFLVVRGDGDPEELAPAVRGSVAEVDGDVPVISIQSLDERLASGLVVERLAVSVLAIAGGFALLLAAVGLYGVLSNAVNRRTPEIGIRVALGADRARVLRNVLGRGLALTGVGLAFGLLVALAAGRAVSSFLYGIPASDPATLGAVSLVLIGVSLLAAWLPARRATRIDPLLALKME